MSGTSNTLDETSSVEDVYASENPQTKNANSPNFGSGNTATYIILVVLILIVIGLAIWLFITRGQLTDCEASESQLCPVYQCPTPTSPCGNAPFRGSAHECQHYFAQESREINPNPGP
jgi:hypothetical protein